MRAIKTLFAILILCASALVQANEIPEMLDKYKAAGASNFNAQAGESLWKKAFKAEDGSMRSCATCHHADITKAGAHKKTGKLIAPMALSVDAEAFWKAAQVKQPDVKVPKVIKRYASAKKIRKWFKRNCKWTYGRECTPQEKGDFLMYLKSK